MAWKQATKTIIYAWEYEILCAMDDAYREEMNRELKDYRARLEEDMKQKGGKR